LDIVLIGTGVSAMLLAESLVQRGCVRRMRIIGPSGPLSPRRLSYWSDVPTPFDASTEASWSELRVFDAGGEVIATTLERYRYRTFRGQQWVAEARARLARLPSVEWIDARVDRVTTTDTKATAHVGERRFEADWVFSSGRLSGFEPSCWQRFEGWEITTDYFFESDAATLLDFRTAADGDLRFLYALPLGPKRLFVEHISYRPSDHGEMLRAYLNDVIGVRSWTVVERERSATPSFRDVPPRQEGRIVHIGAAAGLAKTVTGYAVTRMWRDAESIARGLQERGHPTTTPTAAWLYRVADHFFVDQVKNEPSRLIELVPALFRGAEGDAVLGFLDDDATRREQLKVALTTPRWLRWWLRSA
jgi:lycopene beta-cyclase